MKKIKEKGLDNNFVEISNTSVLDTDKQTELIKAVQEKGTDCKEMRKLARNYDCYIQEIAVQYKDQGLSLVELLEAGRIGLEEAATTFDPNRGSTFSSYAASSIQNKMDMLMESVSNLKNADMEYPTQNCFNILIDNAGDIDFSSSFGNKPMTKDRDTLISINATQYLKTKICNHEYVGIDIPVLLKPEGARENFTVVIVGESPLRDTKKTDTKNQILKTKYY